VPQLPEQEQPLLEVNALAGAGDAGVGVGVGVGVGLVEPVLPAGQE
jgi:hypothetical protein